MLHLTRLFQLLQLARWRVVWLLLILLALTACSRQSWQAATPAIQIELARPLFNPAVGPDRLRVRLTDETAQPLDSATVRVKGDMTHAGMAPVLATAVGEAQNGWYTVPFTWTMSGEWVVTVSATVGKENVQQRFPVLVQGDTAVCQPSPSAYNSQ